VFLSLFSFQLFWAKKTFFAKMAINFFGLAGFK